MKVDKIVIEVDDRAYSPYVIAEIYEHWIEAFDKSDTLVLRPDTKLHDTCFSTASDQAEFVLRPLSWTVDSFGVDRVPANIVVEMKEIFTNREVKVTANFSGPGKIAMTIVTPAGTLDEIRYLE